MKCPHCDYEGLPVLSGPYDRPDGSRMAFYVCADCQKFLPGHYEPPAESTPVPAPAELPATPRPKDNKQAA